MIYLALGDSISIDDYTGVPGGGAASQFARLIGADVFENRTGDGCVTDGVLDALERVSIRPDVVTLTAGGNDFLQAAFWGAKMQAPAGGALLVVRPMANLRRIADRLAGFGCRVIMNTVYDPSDGDDRLMEPIGLTGAMRPAFEALNEGIRGMARERGCLLADLHALFLGHGIVSPEPWICAYIEPNDAGATAIARCWLRLFRGDGTGMES